MASIVVQAAAGVGATGNLRTDPSGLRGQVRLVTGTGPAAGLLAAVLLDQAPIVDADAYVAATIPGGLNAVFATAEMLLTPWTLPPAGVGFFAVAHLNTQGQMDGFGIVATGTLAASTPYRFSWRVLA